MNLKYTIKKLKNSISEETSTVINKSQSIIGTSELSVKKMSYDGSIEEIYKKIGKKIYSKYEKDKKIDKDIIKYCEEIKNIKKDIKSIEKEILKLNSKKLCKICGHKIEEDAGFCGYCGSKQ